MAENYKIAIIGSGPCGMSAGGRAAELGVSHIVIEKADHLSDTIFKFQKGKHVMATPDVLPLRSSMDFSIGIREDILETWNQQTKDLGVNIRFNSEVTEIKGEQGKFTIQLKSGEEIYAEYIVLGIGLQGNLRKVGVPGSDWDKVQYQLDDPDEYEAENIVVIGAGDAAIENAVALSKNNNVFIVNRRGEFARAKDGNIKLIEKAIDDNQITCFYNSNPKLIEPGKLTLETSDGEAEVKCDRIIARLGAIPPRKFVESCGIEFPNKDPASLPELSPKYESNKKGIFIVGALAGFPLIKQSMNQGYEVIEFIQGNKIKPADEPLLEEKFNSILTEGNNIDSLISYIRKQVPILSGLTGLQLREFLIDSTIHVPNKDDIIFERNDYTNSFYMIVDGGVKIIIDENNTDNTVSLSSGEFFGEIGLIAGRRRSATIFASQQSILIESPRRTMIKLINSFDSVQKTMNEVALVRQLRTYLSPNLTNEALAPVLETAEIKNYKPGQILFTEGDDEDGVYLIRKGSVTVSRKIGGREIVIAYVPAGHYVGEMALLNNQKRNATIKAAINTEVIWMDGERFRGLLDTSDELRADVEKKLLSRLVEGESMHNRPDAGNIIEFLVAQGVGEATDILLIDENLCVGCNNCEKACAETHDGISRLNREAGPTYNAVHVPTSCRHCEHPHCMSDCPADSIHRSVNGEVFIDDKCIGCGNCERNCPYGVIHMAAESPKKPGLLSWLLFGSGPGPGENKQWNKDHSNEGARKKAVKCDMCKDLDGGASCVRACPTGAAIRVSPENFFSLSELAGRN